MSMTATISTLNPGTTVLGQPVDFVVTVTNSGASSFSITEIQGTVVSNNNPPSKDGSSAGIGKVYLNGSVLMPSQSQQFYFSVAFNSPGIVNNGSVESYLVNCKIQNSINDPAIVAASPVTMAVTQVPKQASTP